MTKFRQKYNLLRLWHASILFSFCLSPTILIKKSRIRVGGGNWKPCTWLMFICLAGSGSEIAGRKRGGARERLMSTFLVGETSILWPRSIDLLQINLKACTNVADFIFYLCPI